MSSLQFKFHSLISNFVGIELLSLLQRLCSCYLWKKLSRFGLQKVEAYDPTATEFNTFDIKLLFGDDSSADMADQIFAELDTDNLGEVR